VTEPLVPDEESLEHEEAAVTDVTGELSAAIAVLSKSLAAPKVWKGGANTVAVGVAQPLLVSTPRGKYDRLKASMDLPLSLEAPIAKGQKLGMVKVTLDGKEVASAPLVALQAVEEGGFFKRLWHSLLMWWQSV
jgi:D-alanyl-D-alanine carboxypeptidase (penicillin-binding protein 5/6)